MEINATYWEKPQYSSAPPNKQKFCISTQKKNRITKKELVGLYEKKSLNTFINFYK